MMLLSKHLLQILFCQANLSKIVFFINEWYYIDMLNNKPKKKMKVKVIEESPFGLYVWMTQEGAIVADEDGNYLNIQAMKNDQAKIDILANAAKDCGVEGGKPMFLSGYRRVTEEEYEYQRQRLELGLIPDELDIAAFKEEHAQMQKKAKYGR